MQYKTTITHFLGLTTSFLKNLKGYKGYNI